MFITQEDKEMFCHAITKVKKDRARKGIGTLGEKTTHAVFKHYLDPRDEFHEQRCSGFVADILCEGEIIEVQTANFNSLRRKLEAFLKDYEVTIVYPIPATKWIMWINEETGEISDKRKSPKKGTYYHAFKELYKIKSYLTHPNLHFRFILFDVEEYRVLNGWSLDKKKGSVRYDRIPKELQGELMVATSEDYKKLIPETLPKAFLSKDYKEQTKLPLKEAQTALNVLATIGVVTKVGKQGNAIVYEVV